jgi:NadR type nicotinamide-nucleotide adenylyltransferase
MIKIVITGPESTGKTTLANQLVDHFETGLVAEYARRFIDKLERDYVEADLLEIAKGQLELENRQLQKAKNVLICDTDLITIKIWSEYKFGSCDPQILEWIEGSGNDHYLLCGTDVEWQFDVQREHPHDREKLYDIYKKELIFYKKKYTEITGDQKQRFQKVTKLISSFLKK